MMKKRKAMAILLSAAMVFCYAPGSAFAETQSSAGEGAGTAFVDMPTDWSRDALSRAVTNGLLGGYDTSKGKEIRPQGNLTRAEMATVINRAFGASEKTSLSGVTDVPSNAWFADDMAKAAKMKTFAKDTAMRPNDNITRQEAFTVIARAFKIESNDSGRQALNQFSDKGQIAGWAADGLCAMTEKGYVSGNGGAINPKANITRAEFAKIMDNIVKTYISTAGTITASSEGNVMVNVPGVTLKGNTIKGDLIIGDGVGNGEITLEDVTVVGRAVVRGGGVNSVIITGNSSIKNLVIAKVDGNVRVAVQGNGNVDVISVNDGKDDVIIEGKVKNLTVGSSVPVVLKNATVGTVTVEASSSDLTVDKDSKVENVTVSKEAQGSKVAVAGTVTNLKSEAPKTSLAVTGTVKTVAIAATATGTNVEVAKDAKVDNLKNDAKGTTTSGEGKPSNTTGSEATTDKDSGTATKPEDKPSTGGGGGGGGGGSQEQESTLSEVKLTPTTVYGGDKIFAEVSYAGGTGSVAYEWYSSNDGNSLNAKLVGTDPVYQTDPVYHAGKYILVKVTPTGNTKGTEKTSNAVRVLPAPFEYTAEKGSNGNMVLTFTRGVAFENVEGAQAVDVSASWTAVPGIEGLFRVKASGSFGGGTLQIKVSGKNQLTVINNGISDCVGVIGFCNNNMGLENGSFSVTIKGGQMLEPIAGSISIIGEPRAGKTVTAVAIITSPDSGALTYSWNYGGVGNSSSMTIPDTPVAGGDAITVTVTAENYSGQLTYSFIAGKGDAKKTATVPTLKEVTNSTIELNAVPGGEFAISHIGGVAKSSFDWQDSAAFGNLVTAKKYKFVSRVKELPAYLPSAPSAPSEAFAPPVEVKRLEVKRMVEGQAWYRTQTNAAMSFEIYANDEKGAPIDISAFGKMVVKCISNDGNNTVLGVLKEGSEFKNEYDTAPWLEPTEYHNAIYAFTSWEEADSSVLKKLPAGTYNLEISNEPSDVYGYQAVIPFKIYANGGTMTYAQPTNGTMKIVYDNVDVSTGGTLTYKDDDSYVGLEATANDGYRIKEVTIQDAASDNAAVSIEERDLKDLIARGKCRIQPIGDATITVTTEAVPNSLPNLTGVKLYTGWDENRTEIANPSTEGITLEAEGRTDVELEPVWSIPPTGIFTDPSDICEVKYAITSSANAPNDSNLWEDSSRFGVRLKAEDSGKYCHISIKGDGKFFTGTQAVTLKIN